VPTQQIHADAGGSRATASCLVTIAGGGGLAIPKPDASNTGPRVPLVGSEIQGWEAISLAMAAPGRRLVGRRIVNLVLDRPEHTTLTFADCSIRGAWYAVDAWYGGVRPSANAPMTLFEYCELYRGDSATVGGAWFNLRHCELRDGGDLVKSYGRTEVYGCFMHSLWDADGQAHGDVVQIQTGDDFLIHWNTMISINGQNSPARKGGVGSGVTQFGRPLGSVTNARINDNWVNGGAYQLRGGGDWDGTAYSLRISFRRNKHGRTWLYGPESHMGTFNGGRHVSDYDASNVYEDNGRPVAG
jgi:hypothetical protein